MITKSIRLPGPTALALLLLTTSFLSAQNLVRREVQIPDVPGYRTLKCDLHMHTVFSDGLVWPTTRADEIWRDGFDMFAITDHVEYRTHKKDVSLDLSRPYTIAAPRAHKYGLTIVRGAEITRKMPPGHLNAIFLSDENKLKTEKWEDALREAKKQGAFIFWNHPGWTGQRADGISHWYKEHDFILANGLVQGIEIVNVDTYYPKAHQWGLDKKLTLVANSDVHQPIHLRPRAPGEHRPATLVFAKDASPAAVREALFARRTAVWFKDQLIGESRWLTPLFHRSLKITPVSNPLDKKGRGTCRISNCSDVPFTLVRQAALEGFKFPGKLTIPAGRTVLVQIQQRDTKLPTPSTLTIPIRVTNLLVTPTTGLATKISLELKATNKKP